MRPLLASIVVAYGVLAAGPAWAQVDPVDPCLADPVACTQETVSDLTDTVDQTVKDAGETVKDAGETIVEAVDGVTDTGNGVIDDANGGEDSQQAAAGGSPTPGADEGRARAGERGGRGSRTGRDTATTFRSPPQAGRQTVAATAAFPPEPGVLQRIRRAFAESARAFVFPLMLIGLVTAFLVVQSRFDRSDPKLALAPVDSHDEVLTFR